MLSTSKSPAAVVSYIIKFNPLLNPGSKLDYLVIHIYLDHVQKTIAAGGPGNDTFILLNGDKPLLHSNDETLDQPAIRALRDHTAAAAAYYEELPDKITFVNRSLADDWMLIAVKSTRYVMDPINFVFYFFALTTFLSIGVILVTLTPIITNITRPISKLTHAMKQIAMGNMDASVSIKSGDEIELLGEGFNRMAQDIKAYIRQSVEDEKIKHKLQNDLLLSQINPHFIYNTLNTVIYLAKDNRDIIAITEAFIRILQDGVKEGREDYYATVREEIDSVKHYMVIQNYRYPNRFSVNLEVDNDTLEGWIPRMILQPLVENSLFHGVIPKETPGTIAIRIGLRDNRLSIRIEDDGVGMDADTVEALTDGRMTHDSASRIRPIGLANVRELIRNLYGPAAQFAIDSELHRGTSIRIQLPYRRG
jgi:two-component system sensor histidine kinase YesM